MPALLIHVLFAAAVQGLVSFTLVSEGISEFTFYAAIVSILVDLDHRSDEKRSSAVHSLFTMSLLSAICVATAVVAGDVWTGFLLISLFVGFTSHISLDMTDGEGIYIMPRNREMIAPFCRARRPGKSRRRRFHLILAGLSVSVLLVLVCI
ncbi:MAG: hypothetical protein KAW39_08430 [Thermoplasmata archaeon]|nr:hypothetical protein [Thermoplasmata archaeon]